MANRVILDSNRLRISQPGFDVLSNNLTQDQIIFDSTLLTPNIIVGGQLNIPGNSGNTFSTIEVPIGKTLRPYFFFYLENVEDFYAAGGQGGVYLTPFSINKVFYLQPANNQSIIAGLADPFTSSTVTVNHEVDPDMVPYSNGGQFNQYRLRQKNTFTVYYYNNSGKVAKINYGFFDLAFT